MITKLDVDVFNIMLSISGGFRVKTHDFYIVIPINEELEIL